MKARLSWLGHMGTDIVCACVQVVTILNRIYSQFDRLIETNNVYKVETVGEVYMVVGGCPTRTNTHAQDCVNMALAMMRCVPTLRKECAKIVGDVGNSLNIRIGLNSGPIVAGIVGIKNPRYKLFGDTVRVVCVELPCRAMSWCDAVWHPPTPPGEHGQPYGKHKRAWAHPDQRQNLPTCRGLVQADSAWPHPRQGQGHDEHVLRG